MEGEAGAAEGGGHTGPDAGVLVLVADDVRGRGRGVELQAVVSGQAGDVADKCQDGVGVDVQVGGEQVDVAGRTTGAVGGEQRAAFEDEVRAVVAAGEAAEESFAGTDRAARHVPSPHRGEGAQVDEGGAGGGVAVQGGDELGI